ncbi:MAG: hypothetical protein KIT45_07930, partial [Fimbriimonadia bacterium]|nr:hypothetical protein [Fimbriimonadia bacterium]
SSHCCLLSISYKKTVPFEILAKSKWLTTVIPANAGIQKRQSLFWLGFALLLIEALSVKKYLPIITFRLTAVTSCL